MRVPYVVVISGNQRCSREGAYLKGDISFCCEEMRDEWESFLEFRNENWLGGAVGVYLGADEASCDTPIKFCPWCGAAIDLQEVARRDERVPVCGVNLKHSLYDNYCQNKPRPGSAHCGRHPPKEKA